MITAVAVTEVPGLTAVAKPLEPVVSLTSEIDVSDEVQVAKVVRSCWVLFESDNVPIAAYNRPVPGAMLGGE